MHVLEAGQVAAHDDEVQAPAVRDVEGGDRLAVGVEQAEGERDVPARAGRRRVEREAQPVLADGEARQAGALGRRVVGLLAGVGLLRGGGPGSGGPVGLSAGTVRRGAGVRVGGRVRARPLRVERRARGGGAAEGDEQGPAEGRQARPGPHEAATS
jgi:ribosomal 50S subunit-recycling heat shock protein